MSEQPTSVSVHVVIATHGRQNLLERTLKSLSSCSRPSHLEAVWVIENGSDAGARQTCEAMSNELPIRYEHRAELGKAKALQQVLDQLDAGLMLMTDDDVRIAPGWLQRYEQAYLEQGPDGFWGGPVAIDYDRPPPDWLKPYLPPSARGFPDSPEMAQQLQALGLRANLATTPILGPCLLGANYAVPVAALKHVGGFSKQLGTGAKDNPVGEEEELQKRLLSAGYTGHLLSGDDATVWHHVPTTRCSRPWVLHRYERIGLTTGLTVPTSSDGAPRIAGLPRWVWRKWSRLASQALLSWLQPDPQKRFVMRLRYFQFRGYVRGMKRRLREADAASDLSGES